MTAPTQTCEVFKEGQHVCRVRYRLQQFDSPAGHVEISGQILVEESGREDSAILNALRSGDSFTLKFEDGNSLEVWFHPIAPHNGVLAVCVCPGKCSSHIGVLGLQVETRTCPLTNQNHSLWSRPICAQGVTFRKISTTWGSKCLPAKDRMCSRTFSSGQPSR